MIPQPAEIIKGFAEIFRKKDLQKEGECVTIRKHSSALMAWIKGRLLLGLFDNWRNAGRRGIFSPDKADFLQAYCMYVKKNQQSMAGKGPLPGVLTIIKQAPGGFPRVPPRGFVLRFAGKHETGGPLGRHIPAE